MSKFRCEVDVSFNSEADAIAFFNLVEAWKDKVAPATESTGPQDIAIITRARYHECFHDEVPPKPCGGYVDIDFKNSKVVEHKTVSGTIMVVSADNLKSYTKAELSSDIDKIDSVAP
jgi:hypothetical protein